MPKEKLLAYFKKHLDKGFPKEKIVEKLKKSRYSEESINEVLAELEKEKFPEEKAKISLWHPKIYGAVLILVILIAGTVVFLGKERVTSMPEGQEEIFEEEKPIVVDLKSSYQAYGSPLETAIPLASDSFVSGTNKCETVPRELSGDTVKACEDKYYLYRSIKNFVDGKCDDISAFENWIMLTTPETCAAVFSGDCSNLEELKAVFCEFLVRNDRQICSHFKEVPGEELPTGGMMTDLTFRECQEIMPFYIALKEDNPDSCEAISTILNREACRRMVAGKANFFEDFTEALSLIARVKVENEDLSNCEGIEIKELKDLCTDESIGYNETFEKISDFIIHSLTQLSEATD